MPVLNVTVIGHAPLARGRGRHVEHAADAVDLLFQRRGHGFRDLFGGGAGIHRIHRHRGRRDVRVLVHRQREVRDHAHQRDHHRHGGREDRPLDEEVRKAHGYFLSAGARGAEVAAAPPCGSFSVLVSPSDTPDGKAVTVPWVTATLRPGRARCTPLITTRSSAARPAAYHAQAAEQPARLHHLLRNLVLGTDHIHHLPRLVGDDGFIGHHQCVEGLRRIQAQVAEHAGREEPVGIRHRGARANGAGAAIQRVVEEIQPALPAILGFVLQADVHLAVAWSLPARRYFSSAASGASNTKRMGFSLTMVVSTVLSAATRLPGARRRHETRPAMGAWMRV